MLHQLIKASLIKASLVKKAVNNGLLPILCIWLTGCSNDLAPVTVEADHAVAPNPEISSDTGRSGFKLLDADPVDLLSDDRLQIINYWATWCLPCLEEMPELAAFRKEHHEAVEVYAVNYDQLDVDQLRKEIVALGVEIPALINDPNERLGYERPTVLPTTVVMHSSQVKEVLVGPQTRETLEAVLEKWSGYE